MKEKIYTIPVNEAFDKDTECPFCELTKKLDADILDYILGPSYMEEDIREETDKHGFCKYHYKEMFEAQNRLGVALMVSTHLKKINKDIEKVIESELSDKKGFLKRDTDFHLQNYIEVLSSDCYACKRMENRMNSYVNTFCYLYKKEEEFKNKVKNGKGFCIEHFSMIVTEAKKRMKPDEFSEFMKVMVPIEKENLNRIDEELDWFIKKFDYRFNNEPWKNSKDSLERSILKISSTIV